MEELAALGRYSSVPGLPADASERFDDYLFHMTPDRLARWLMKSGWVRDYDLALREAEGFLRDVSEGGNP